ncbi:MAG: lipoprotein [Pseudomonadales bacterium]|nr:lipoprotein [Pseudomonadales bacterium]
MPIIVILLCAMLSACGQKGPLYPQETTPQSAASFSYVEL